MRRACIAVLLVVLAACQQDNRVLPTQVDINVLSDQMTSTAMPSPTTIRTGPTLPPTFTPTPEPSPTFVEPTEIPTETPIGYSADGTIYYIYNNDAIMALSADGSHEEIVVTFGIDQPISDLTLSPDGELLAYVAPGNGAAREIYIASLDGTYTQQVTCLGFQDLRELAWSPDNEWLAFYGSQVPGGPYDIYRASWIGANNCPAGNGQSRVANPGAAQVGDVIYSADGNTIYFSNQETYGVDLSTFEVWDAITLTRGAGPDFGYAISPFETFLMAYLRSSSLRNDTDGELLVIAVDVLNPRALVVFEQVATTQKLQWSKDGKFLLTSTPSSIFILDWAERLSESIVTNTTLPPLAVYSPDDSKIAYIDADPNNPALPQIYTVDLDGFDPQQVTFHEEGSISDLIWVESNSQ